MSGESLKDRLAADLRSQEPPGPERLLDNYVGGGERFVLVRVPHNSYAADQTSACDGSVITKFSIADKGSRSSPCHKCKEPVTISVSALKLGMRLV